MSEPSPPVAPTPTSTPFVTHITAQPEDIDELGHVNNAVWVRWLQDVATQHWISAAPPEHVAAYLWVVTRHEIDYRGNVGPGETVTARTWVGEAPRGARFDRMVEFIGADRKVKVAAKSTWALIDRQTGRILRVPAEVAAPFIA
jgi:acyl-CoA thioester hydrolase